MSQFTPPTFKVPLNADDNGHGEEFSLWRHYGNVIETPYVVLITGGVVTPYPGVVSPTVHDMKGNAEVPNATASYTGADVGSGEGGRAVFYGGRTYDITDAEAFLLLAAGYSAGEDWPVGQGYDDIYQDTYK